MTDLLLRGRRMTFQSPLSLDEATRRLQGEISPPRWGLAERRTSLFEGTFDAGRFRMVRLVRGRNSFRPLIDGVVSGGPSGSRVDVEMRLHPLVLGLCAMFLLVGLLLAGLAAFESLQRQALTPQLLVGPAVALAMTGILGATALEARRAARLIERLLDAAPSRG